jgi:hypothetical protein
MIRIATRRSDEDVLQLRCEVSDGASTFVNSAYASLEWYSDAAVALENFGGQIYGGIYDLEAGTPGPEFAEGAFQARFHWYTPSRLYISTRQESDYFDFKGTQVVSAAKLFLRTEPALLDRFITELREAGAGQRQEATLECVPLAGG